MCEDQTTRKTHACSRTATRAVEEKIIVHRLFSVLSSVRPRRRLLCFHSRWSSCGSGFRHHGGTGTLGNLAFSDPRLTPGGFAGPVHLHPISSSVWYHHVLGVTFLASSDSFVCLLTCGTSRSLIVESAFGRTWHVVFTGTGTGCVSPSPSVDQFYKAQ